MLGTTFYFIDVICKSSCKLLWSRGGARNFRKNFRKKVFFLNAWARFCIHIQKAETILFFSCDRFFASMPPSGSKTSLKNKIYGQCPRKPYSKLFISASEWVSTKSSTVVVKYYLLLHRCHLEIIVQASVISRWRAKLQKKNSEKFSKKISEFFFLLNFTSKRLLRSHCGATRKFLIFFRKNSEKKIPKKKFRKKSDFFLLNFE